MNIELYRHYINFFLDKWLTFLLVFFIALILAISLRYFPESRQAIVNGFFVLNSSVLAVVLALHNYHGEQKTSRLQHVYFEDALLGQAKSIENILSCLNTNIHEVESSLHLVSTIMHRKNKLSLENKKNIIKHNVDVSLKNLTFNIDLTDFKKETINKLIINSGVTHNFLLEWVEIIEKNAYEFYTFLRCCLYYLKAHLEEEDFDITEFIALAGKSKQKLLDNYFLITRHAVFFDLFSKIVLEFSSENYAAPEKIFIAFRKDKIRLLMNSIDQAYKSLIKNFQNESIGFISHKKAVNLAKCISAEINIPSNLKTHDS